MSNQSGNNTNVAPKLFTPQAPAKTVIKDPITGEIKLILNDIKNSQNLTGKLIRKSKKMFKFNGISSYMMSPLVNSNNLSLSCLFDGDESSNGTIVATDHFNINKTGKEIEVFNKNNALIGKATLGMNNIHFMVLTISEGDVKIYITPDVEINAQVNNQQTKSVLFGVNQRKEDYFNGYIGGIVIKKNIETLNAMYEISGLLKPGKDVPIEDRIDLSPKERDEVQVKNLEKEQELIINNRVINHINSLNVLTDKIKAAKQNPKLIDLDTLHQVHNDVKEQIAHRRWDFSEYQYKLDDSVQDYKIKDLENKLKILNQEAESKGILHNDRKDYRSVSNPHFGRGLNISRNYEIKNNHKYPDNVNTNNKVHNNLTENQCFNKCKAMRNCVGATFMASRDSNQNKSICNIADSDTESAGAALVPAPGSIAIRKNEEYNIFINDGCLYNNSTLDEKGDPISDYGTENCKLDKTNQKFKVQKITDKESYNANLADSSKRMDKVDGIIPLPFYIINPSLHSQDAVKECITLDKSGDITIEPCNLGNYQRWSASHKERSC